MPSKEAIRFCRANQDLGRGEILGEITEHGIQVQIKLPMGQGIENLIFINLKAGIKIQNSC